jgi:hypothetical protein
MAAAGLGHRRRFVQAASALGFAGEQASIDFGTSTAANVVVTGALTNHGSIDLDGSLTAGTIDNAGTLQAVGSSTVTSRAVSSSGTVAAIDGTLCLPDAPSQLRGGVLDGGSWDALCGDVVAPGDISTHSGGRVVVSGAPVSLGGCADGGGTLAVVGTYTQHAGALTSLTTGTLSARALTIGSGSALTGTGSVQGRLTNDGRSSLQERS